MRLKIHLCFFITTYTFQTRKASCQSLKTESRKNYFAQWKENSQNAIFVSMWWRVLTFPMFTKSQSSVQSSRPSTCVLGQWHRPRALFFGKVYRSVKSRFRPYFCVSFSKLFFVHREITELVAEIEDVAKSQIGPCSSYWPHDQLSGTFRGI